MELVQKNIDLNLVFVLICLLFFSVSENVRVYGDFSSAVSPATLFFPHSSLTVFFAQNLQLRMRYAKRSTCFRCRGREPQPGKLSTTSVQLMPLVSNIMCPVAALLLALGFDCVCRVFTTVSSAESRRPSVQNRQ